MHCCPALDYAECPVGQPACDNACLLAQSDEHIERGSE